ncbi:MAG: signal recognition particle-docking protein FtsY [Candidatus Aenigmarchaeota archaeon]|nr:signal recognition particle-docking protein FtsY [Candidatus Aenigmarchaeota archaeon]
MFGLLKKHFSKSVKKVTEKVLEKEISGHDIDNFFSEIEIELMQDNVAVDVIDYLKKRMKEELIQKQVGRMSAREEIRTTFKNILMEIIGKEPVSIEDTINSKKAAKEPACIIFLGFNGSGKTTTIAKVASALKMKGHQPVLAAADTFRAASIEQLQHHGEKLGVPVIKHEYGSDPAAVVFDAMKYAKTKGKDVVLVDTAGRMHNDKNLMDELSKIVRVNKPDLKILVIDSLTGNDVVIQATNYDKAVNGIDGMILTKTEINEKGGSLLSATYATGKPILFLGTGQKYEDLIEFSAEKTVDELLD